GQVPGRTGADAGDQRTGIQAAAGLVDGDGCHAGTRTRQIEPAEPPPAGVVGDGDPDDAFGRGGEGGGEHGGVQHADALAGDRGRCGDHDARPVRGAVGAGDVVRLLGVQRGDSGSELPETIGELHYLTAPAVMPRVRVRWKMRKKMSVGMMPSRADALVVVTSMSRSPCSTLIATGTVWLALDARNVSGMRNSFHVQMKKKISSTDRVGRLIGKTTRQRICHRVAPSMDAASSTSLGKVPYTEESRYVPNAAWMTVKTMITDQTLSY